MELKIKRLLVLLLFFAITAPAFGQNCSDYLKYRLATKPFKKNTQSRSAKCLTGKTYRFLLPLTQGKDYRVSFYASPIFNNDIHFTIIDKGTGEEVLNLPGATEENKAGEIALASFYDDETGNMIHPFFDFVPETSTTLEIIIDVKTPEDTKRVYAGCVGVFIQDKISEQTGFPQQ